MSVPNKFDFKLEKVYVVPGQHPGKHSLWLVAEVSYQAEHVPAGAYIKKMNGYEGLKKFYGAGTLLVPITAEPKQRQAGFVCRIESGYSVVWPEGTVTPSTLREYFGLTALHMVEGMAEAARVAARAHWNTAIVPDSPHDGKEDPSVFSQIVSSNSMRVALRATKILGREYYGEFTVTKDEAGKLSARVGYGQYWKVDAPSKEGQSIEQRAGQEIASYLMPLLTNRWKADIAIVEANALLETLRAISEADQALYAAYWETKRAQDAMRATILKLAGIAPSKADLDRALLIAKEKGMRL